jgi:hypothetical protein
MKEWDDMSDITKILKEWDDMSDITKIRVLRHAAECLRAGGNKTRPVLSQSIERTWLIVSMLTLTVLRLVRRGFSSSNFRCNERAEVPAGSKILP